MKYVQHSAVQETTTTEIPMYGLQVQPPSNQGSLTAPVISGRVLPTKNGRIVPPRFSYTNAFSALRKRIEDSRQFEFDLLELFLVAGFGGEFKCNFIEAARGSSHTKGLKVKTLAQGGVHLSAHYGDNGANVICHINCPSDLRNPDKFFEYLRDAERRLGEEEREQTQKRRQEYADKGVAEFAKFRHSAPHPAFRPQAVQAAIEPPAAAPPAPTQASAPEPQTPASRGVPFYRDTTSLALFIGELEKHATEEGVVTRTNCLAVLSNERFARASGTGSMLKGIMTEGHLKEVQPGSELLQFGGFWLLEWQKKHPQLSQPSPRLTAASPAQDVDISIGTLMELDVLTDKARALRLQRESLERSLAAVRPKIVRLETELGELRSEETNAAQELQQVESELADPKYAGAKDHLALLRKLLDKAL